MKRFTIDRVITGVAATFIAGILPLAISLPGLAQTAPSRAQNSRLELAQNKQDSQDPQTTAFDLAEEAYQGMFEKQGISGFEMLEQEYQAGKITAKDVVEAAVNAGKLSPNTLNNESYIKSVDSQLNALIQNNDGSMD